MPKKEKIVKHRFYQGPHFSTELGDSEVYSVFRVQRQLLAQKDAGDIGALATDNGGSILAVDEKNVRRAYSYTPYGLRSLICGKRDLLGFNGELQEYFTHYYMLGNGHRGLHRHVFLSPDGLSPFGKGGINAYAYGSGDPINYIDPSGRFILFKAAAMLLSTMAGAFSWGAALFTGSRVAQVTGGIAVGAGLAAAASITTNTAHSLVATSASAAALSIRANFRQMAFNARMEIFNTLRHPAANTPNVTSHLTLAARAALALPKAGLKIANTMNFNNINDPAVIAVLKQGPAYVRAAMAAQSSPNIDAFIGKLKEMDTDGLPSEITALIRQT